ncbi:MAG: cox cluster protein, partial [Haloarculaceae archaeon]
MNEQPGLSDQYRMASPWPLFVALGLALSEVGVVLALFPVAVGGLLLFGGSVVGILKESGYVAAPWTPLAVLGAVFAVAGGALVAVWGDGGGILTLFASPNPVVARAVGIGVA